MSCRVCVQRSWTEPTSIDVSRRLFLFRRHFNIRPSRPNNTQTPALPAGHVLSGRRGPQPHDAVDPRGARRRERAAALHRRNVLPGRFSHSNRVADVLCRSLLPSWKYVSRASTSRKFFGCRGRGRADDGERSERGERSDARSAPGAQLVGWKAIGDSFPTRRLASRSAGMGASPIF